MEAIKAATKEATFNDLNIFQQRKKVSAVYKTHREMSVKEDINLMSLDLWLRKTFPVVVFANSCPPEYRNKIFRCETEVSNLTEDSTDVMR